MSLAARLLEANGLPTLVLGSAFDIVTHCRVPRYVHVDFPLGNPCGKPWDEVMQLAVITEAMDFFAAATSPDSVRRLAHRWSDDESWRDRYAEVTDRNRLELLRKGEQSRRQQNLGRDSGKSWLNKID